MWARAVVVIALAGCGRIDFDPRRPALDGWKHQLELEIDNSTRAEELIDFPLLVVLTPSRIDYASAAADGHDLRFVDGTDTTLAYELEHWDPAATSLVWVRVPRVAASTTTTITLAYGNPDAPPQAHPQATWATEFAGVFHMEGALVDSTINQLSAAPFDCGFGAATGVIGSALLVSRQGPPSYAKVMPSALLEGPTTISGWIRQDQDALLNGFSSMLAAPIDGISADAAYLGLHFGLTYGEVTDTSAVGHELQGAARANGTWTHLALVDDGSTATLYVDGVLATSAAHPAVSSRQFGYLIGGDCDSCPGPIDVAGSDFLEGQIDELRFERVTRSAAWIDATYHAMTDTLLTYR